MSRCAVLLCVHNALKDLHWWIAHHLSVGFDALLICDDQSDDGTWEFLQNAAHRYDIRIMRTNPALEDTITRRETAQKELVRQAGQSLHWILPLALDEYFYPENDSVHNFITQLKEKYGEETFNLTMSFPINWCIMGLGQNDSNKLDSQCLSPRVLFTRHAPQDFNDHKIVRFICRPEALFEKLPDPFSWIDHEVDWSYGRILHDAAASSQNIARRYYNRNNEHLAGTERFLDKSYAIVLSLIHAFLLALAYRIKEGLNLFPDPGPIQPSSFRFFAVVTETSQLAFDPDKKTMVWVEKDKIPATRFSPFYLIGDVKDEDIPREGLFLWGWSPPRGNTPHLISQKSGSGYLGAFLELIPLHIVEYARKVSLINRLDQSTILPEDPAFWLKPVKIDETLFPKAPALLKNWTNLLRYGFSAFGVTKALKENAWISPSLLASALFALPETERAMLLPPYLKGIFHVSLKS